ncbi:hypothetical protein BG006_002680 [Podila minutissima]|uniref:Tafazzin family protein n=1 Tax=Podila minutissima TaxID=64525 RepID=A0A9P5SMZ0_9FUNG|nr:hypothetical protein BG006_002680 [Podila minutissima]
MVIAGVAVISKAFMTFGAQTSVHNIDPFLDVLADDPLLWGALPWKCYWNPSRTIRYALGAQELCYPNKTIGAFFQCGQVVPIVRGNGIFQPAVNESIRLLQQGKWVHLFPEGKVNQSSEVIRLKWGIGRILLELAGRPIAATATAAATTTQSTSAFSPQFTHTFDSKDSNNNNNDNDNDGRTWDQIKDTAMPLVVPIYHFGMDDILRLYPDNSSPVFPKWGLPLTIVFGEPIDFSEVMTAYKAGALDEVEARVRVTARVHAALEQLRAVAQMLHEDQVRGMEDNRRRARSQSVLNVARVLSWIRPVGWGW